MADERFKTANGMYRRGIASDDPAILKRSFELLQQAADRGHVKAMNNLVTSYLDGDGVDPSEAKAVELSEELIKRDVGMGYYHMAVFLQQGIGVKQDRTAALAYFRRSADLGNAQGQLVVGEKLLAAFALTPDRAQGFAIGTSMLRCALAQGLGDAGYSLGVHYGIAEEDGASALAAFQAAARLGHDMSLFALEKIFERRKYGVAIDAARAACYSRLSDELGADKTKTFPAIDKICPLPPAPLPGR